MNLSTLTATNTITITNLDVRSVMKLGAIEISAICNAAQHMVREFDIDSALQDLSIMALNDAITSFALQIYLNGKIVREYRYVISADGIAAYGPAAHQPPLGYVPQGAHVRLIAFPNNTADAMDWFRRLGWVDSTPLEYPAGAQYQAYGAFASGSFGMSRELLSDPAYDQSGSTPSFGPMQKEY